MNNTSFCILAVQWCLLEQHHTLDFVKRFSRFEAIEIARGIARPQFGDPADVEATVRQAERVLGPRIACGGVVYAWIAGLASTSTEQVEQIAETQRRVDRDREGQCDAHFCAVLRQVSYFNGSVRGRCRRP